MIRLCASAVVYRINGGVPHFLLTTRKNKDLRSGKCILPKGGIDPFCSPMQAASQEVREETGECCSVNGVLLGSYSKYNRKEGVINQIEVFGLAWDGTALNPKGSDEPRKVIWSALDEALDLIDPYLAPFIIRMNQHLEACHIHEAHKKSEE